MFKAIYRGINLLVFLWVLRLIFPDAFVILNEIILQVLNITTNLLDFAQSSSYI
jgi:hypothetical protein